MTTITDPGILEGVADRLGTHIIEGLGKIYGAQTVYTGANTALLQVKASQRTLALALLGIFLTILGLYASLMYGNATIDKFVDADKRYTLATVVLNIIFLLLYFVSRRSKQYEVEERGYIDVMLSYEDQHYDGGGVGHQNARSFAHPYFRYSPVDMALVGCTIFAIIAFCYHLLH